MKLTRREKLTNRLKSGDFWAWVALITWVGPVTWFIIFYLAITGKHIWMLYAYGGVYAVVLGSILIFLTGWGIPSNQPVDPVSSMREGAGDSGLKIPRGISAPSPPAVIAIGSRRTGGANINSRLATLDTKPSTHIAAPQPQPASRH